MRICDKRPGDRHEGILNVHCRLCTRLHERHAIVLNRRTTPRIDLNSLDFVINRFSTKLFKTSDIDIVKTCHSVFSFDLPSVIIEKRAKSSKTVYDVMCLVNFFFVYFA